MKNNRCILWDFDNTLAKRNGMWVKSVMSVLEKNGYDCDAHEKTLSKSFSTGFPWHRYHEPHDTYMTSSWWSYLYALIDDALKMVGIDDSNIRSNLSKQVKKEYLTIDEWFIYEDTLETLKKSQQKGFDNVIVSNHVPELKKLVNGLGITKYFVDIFSSALLGYDKPNKLFFSKVLSQLNYKTYYMVGDSSNRI